MDGPCDICGASAVAEVMTLTLSGYTTGEYEFSFSQHVSFSSYGDARPRACLEHRAALVDRLIKRVAPKPLRAFRSFNWSAELTDRSRQEGRVHRPDPVPPARRTR
jgi:hypothetical protein